MVNELEKAKLSLIPLFFYANLFRSMGKGAPMKNTILFQNRYNRFELSFSIRLKVFSRNTKLFSNHLSKWYKDINKLTFYVQRKRPNIFTTIMNNGKRNMFHYCRKAMKKCIHQYIQDEKAWMPYYGRIEKVLYGIWQFDKPYKTLTHLWDIYKKYYKSIWLWQ